MKSPKISIVIPVYNGSNYLKQAIDSALAQTYKNVEVIVVNDGSTDGDKTENIAKSYGDKIRYFKKKNGRVASALNFGIKKMKGDWFAWLSHDDLFLKNKSVVEAQYIDNYPSVKVFYCNNAVVNAGGVLQFSDNPIKPKKIKGGIWYFRTWIYGCSMLIHKSCFKRVGMFNVKNRTAQDMEMALALLDAYEFCHIPKVLVKRRNHSASDFHKLRKLNVKEGDIMMIDQLTKKGIGYYFPEMKGSDYSPKEKARAYNELAKHLFRGNPKVADFCLDQSQILWFSLQNPAIYERIVGAYIIEKSIDSFYFVRNTLHGAMLKITNVFNTRILQTK